MLSDWTDEDPHQVLRTLKRGSEWYALEKGSGQSILGAARAGKLGAYFSRELQRMPAMDIADVAYDRFFVITSYSIHYTKLYEERVPPGVFLIDAHAADRVFHVRLELS